jgi:hypothetical protein
MLLNESRRKMFQRKMLPKVNLENELYLGHASAIMPSFQRNPVKMTGVHAVRFN